MSDTTGPIFFVIEAAADTKAIDGLTQFNDTLSRLHARRVPEIAVAGPLLKSKLAWKLATFQQAVLYRVVMLASGCALNWNAGNVLCSYLAARALIETAVIFLTIEPELELYIQKEDLGAIDSILMNRIFSTRNEQLIQDYPASKAVNILTLIDKLDQHGFHGLRQHYDFLSEICHPNASGQSHFFGFRDPETHVTHYSDARNLSRHMDHILGGAMLLPLIERVMDHVDNLIVRLAELHHRIAPIGGVDG